MTDKGKPTFVLAGKGPDDLPSPPLPPPSPAGALVRREQDRRRVEGLSYKDFLGKAAALRRLPAHREERGGGAVRELRPPEGGLFRLHRGVL